MGLPSELHREILLRLPASSLFRFRAVCKSWCHEIDDPSFIRAHTVNNHRTSTSNSNLLLTSSSGAIYSIPVDSLNYVDGQRYLSVTRVPGALLPPGSNLRLAADSGDGLVLLIRHKEWVIWNPLTGDYFELAPTCLARTPFLGCGIGYDPSSDDYKVVSILEEKKPVNPAHIYSLRSNSWKMIEEKCPSRMWTPSAPTVLNGALHWVTEDMGEIVALDLATEKFRKLPVPYSSRTSYHVYCKVLGGRLVVFQDEDLCTAWVLKDYGALKPEWVRLITPMGLSLIKEETQLAVSYGCLILLWDVKNHSEKLIWIDEEQVNFSQHMDTLIVAGENIFRFGMKRNWSEADDKRSEKIQVLFSEKELRPFVCTCGGHQMTD